MFQMSRNSDNVFMYVTAENVNRFRAPMAIFRCCNARQTEDEFGYTASQKTEMITFWERMLQPNLEIHGRNIFLTFLREYPEYYHIWNIPEDPVHLAEILPLHGQVALFSLDRLMRDLKKGATPYIKSVRKLVDKHLTLKTDSEAMQRYIATITRYIFRKFSDDLRDTEISTALNIFFNVIQHEYDSDASRVARTHGSMSTAEKDKMEKDNIDKDNIDKDKIDKDKIDKDKIEKT